MLGLGLGEDSDGEDFAPAGQRGGEGGDGESSAGGGLSGVFGAPTGHSGHSNSALQYRSSMLHVCSQLQDAGFIFHSTGLPRNLGARNIWKKGREKEWEEVEEMELVELEVEGVVEEVELEEVAEEAELEEVEGGAGEFCLE